MAKKKLKDKVTLALLINHELYVIDFADMYESVEHAIFSCFGINADKVTYHILWRGPRYHIG